MASAPWVPIRTCIGCRRRLPKPQLIVIKLNEGRFEVYPPGTKLPGRSLYLCPRADCLDKLRRRKKVVFKAQPPGRSIIPLSSEAGRELLAKLARLIERLGPPDENRLAGPGQARRGEM